MIAGIFPGPRDDLADESGRKTGEEVEVSRTDQATGSQSRILEEGFG